MENDQVKEHVDLIREVFNYSHRFKGSTFVIKMEDTVIYNPLFSSLVKDLALLHRVGIRIVIIPGAKNRIDEVLDRYGIHSETINGVRISSEQAIPFIKMAAFDVSNRVMTTLAEYQANAVIGNWVRARGIGVLKGKDFEQSGKVEKINVELVNRILDEGLIPIFPCIGWNAVGKPYNISSNELASVVSVQLEARKLFFLGSSPVPKIDTFMAPMGANISLDGRISNLNVELAREFIKLNDSADPLLREYIRLACDVCNSGVARVHILDGRMDGIILKEIFSNLGMGTMIHGNIYESIRNMETRDVSDILRLMQPFILKDILVNRTEEQLMEKYQDYVVYEMDGSLHGCGALHAFSDKTGELAAIVVDQKYEHLGIGQKIVSFLINRAKDLGLGKVFVLTTQTADWFQVMGFKEGTYSDIPDDKKSNYDRRRNSKIFIREI